jgi:hypothetical protein
MQRKWCSIGKYTKEEVPSVVPLSTSWFQQLVGDVRIDQLVNRSAWLESSPGFDTGLLRAADAARRAKLALTKSA